MQKEKSAEVDPLPEPIFGSLFVWAPPQVSIFISNPSNLNLSGIPPPTPNFPLKQPIVRVLTLTPFISSSYAHSSGSPYQLIFDQGGKVLQKISLSNWFGKKIENFELMNQFDISYNLFLFQKKQQTFIFLNKFPTSITIEV